MHKVIPSSTLLHWTKPLTPSPSRRWSAWKSTSVGHQINSERINIRAGASVKPNNSTIRHRNGERGSFLDSERPIFANIGDESERSQHIGDIIEWTVGAVYRSQVLASFKYDLKGKKKMCWFRKIILSVRNGARLDHEVAYLALTPN